MVLINMVLINMVCWWSKSIVQSKKVRTRTNYLKLIEKARSIFVSKSSPTAEFAAKTAH